MNTPLTEEQLTEFQSLLTEMKGGWSRFKDLPDLFASSKTETETMRKDLTDVRRLLATRHSLAEPKSYVGWPPVTRLPGFVTDDCARHLTAIALAARLRSG